MSFSWKFIILFAICWTFVNTSGIRRRFSAGSDQISTRRRPGVDSSETDVSGSSSVENPEYLPLPLGRYGEGGDLQSYRTTNSSSTVQEAEPKRKRRRRLRKPFLQRRTPNNMLRRALHLDNETNSSMGSDNQLASYRPSFINFDEFVDINPPSSTASTPPAAEAEISDSDNPNNRRQKHMKKYYPVFRKSNHSPSSSPNSTVPNPEQEKIEYFKKKYLRIQGPTAAANLNLNTTPAAPSPTAEKDSDEMPIPSKLIAKVNPPLFSLRSVSDLRTDESANPYLEGVGSPGISIDLGGGNSKTLRVFHPLLNSDSGFSSDSQPGTSMENSTSTITSTTSPPTTTSANDILLPDDIFSETSTNRVHRKGPPIFSIGSQEFIDGLGLTQKKNCSPSDDGAGADNSPSSNSPFFSFSLPTPGTTNLPNSENQITTTTTSSSSSGETTTTEIPLTNLPSETYIVDLVDSPPPTTPKIQIPSSTSTSDDDVNKIQIQREAVTPFPGVNGNNLEPSSNENVSPAPTTNFNFNQPGTTLNPFDFGSILNLFQPMPPATQVAPTTQAPKVLGEQPLIGGIMDSLNSLQNLLGSFSPSSASSTNTNFFQITTPRPQIFVTTQSPLQKALSNMVNVLTNPFGGQGIGNEARANSISLKPQPAKPAVPLNPTDYLSQLLQLGTDVRSNSQDVKVDVPRAVADGPAPAQAFQPPSPPPPTQAAPTLSPILQSIFNPATTTPATPRIPFLQNLFAPTTRAPSLFDFGSLLNGNWLTGGVTTTPSPLNLFSLLTGSLNPFSILAPRQPSLFSASATNQQQAVYTDPKDPNGLYYWVDMNTFFPGQDPETSPTTGIRPKLGQRDHFLRIN